MTRWRASTAAERVDVASVVQVVPEMHIMGRPTNMVVGDAFILIGNTNVDDTGSIIGVPAGHIVARMDGGRTFLLRPRKFTDPDSGLAPPRGKPSSDWVVERIS